MSIVLRHISAAAGEALRAGRLPDDVRVAADYPTEFSAGVGEHAGEARPIGPFFLHRDDDDVVGRRDRRRFHRTGRGGDRVRGRRLVLGSRLCDGSRSGAGRAGARPPGGRTDHRPHAARLPRERARPRQGGLRPRSARRKTSTKACPSGSTAGSWSCARRGATSGASCRCCCRRRPGSRSARAARPRRPRPRRGRGSRRGG